MTKYFSRLSQEKLYMYIKVALVDLTSTGKLKDEFKIEFKRGPLVLTSNNYTFPQNGVGDGKLKMTENFEKVSNFYMSSKGEFQSKSGEFRLKSKGKTLDIVPIDLKTQIGPNNAPLAINFNKQGVIMTVQFDISPACRVKHAHLFNELTGEEAAEAKMTNGSPAESINSTRASSNNNAEFEALENQILTLKAENENLREEI